MGLLVFLLGTLTGGFVGAFFMCACCRAKEYDEVIKEEVRRKFFEE